MSEETKVTTLTTSREPRAVQLSTRAKRLLRKSKSDSTLRVYANYWSQFTNYALDHGIQPLGQDNDAELVEVTADYLSELAESGASVNTIDVAHAAIAFGYKTAGRLSPTKHAAVNELMKGIRREVGKLRPVTKKEAAKLDELSAMLATLDTSTLKGKRDRALLLVGYGGAFRRSELAALDVSDLRFNKNELKLTVRSSKTDQDAKGMTKTIPLLAERDAELCPVRALRAWLDAAGIASGAVFRQMTRHDTIRGSKRLSDQSIALVVKQAAKAAGLDWRHYAGHSLRRGFVTQAMDLGATDSDIMQQTGHTSEAVMRGYRQETGVGSKRAVKAAFGKKPRKTLSQKAQE